LSTTYDNCDWISVASVQVYKDVNKFDMLDEVQD